MEKAVYSVSLAESAELKDHSRLRIVVRWPFSESRIELMLKFIGGTIGVIFLIGLLVVIGLLSLIF